MTQLIETRWTPYANDREYVNTADGDWATWISPRGPDVANAGDGRPRLMPIGVPSP